MNQNGHKTPTPPSVISLLGAINHNDDMAAQFRNALNKKENFQSACTLKTFTPLLQIIAHEQEQGVGDPELSKLARTLMTHIRKQAMDVCIGINLDKSNLDWGRSFFCTAIAEQLATVWPARGRDSLSINWATAFCELAQPIMTTKSIPDNWTNTSTEISIVATTVTAMQNLMREYYLSNLFHTDKSVIQSEFTQLLLQTTSEMVDFVNDHYPQTDESRCSLAQSYIKNGGHLLATLWHNYAKTSHRYYHKQATPKEQQYFQQYGFPLADLQTRFKQDMASLRNISLQTIEATQRAFTVASSTPPAPAQPEMSSSP